jgi:hypothetical protein
MLPTSCFSTSSDWMKRRKGMKRFQSYLEERFVNLIGSDAKKADFADEVFSLLQKSYASIGGIHGNGFKNKEDMIKNIPFWKLSRKDGRIVAVAMYKDKGGRKSVAIGTDGSEEGKKQLALMVRDDIDRAYKEVSSKSLSFMKKQLPIDQLKSYIVDPSKVEKIIKEPIRKPPADDPELVRHKELAHFFYQRKIGNEWHTKLLVGTLGKFIK